MKKGCLIIFSVCLIILVAVSGCDPKSLSQVDATQTGVSTPTITAAASPEPSSPGLYSLADYEAALESIYAGVSPSVVNVRVVQKEEISFPILPEIPGFPFFESPLPEDPQEYYSRGLGSGFVWDMEGHIVTNFHVISGADRISVTFQDGTTVPGNMVGADPDSDLAVVKVDTEAKNLKPVKMGDSTLVKPGHLAIAIGNPYGLEGTMTVGIISALGRLLPVKNDVGSGSTYSIPDVIQTDAPINPGNSGGVLVDRSGSVIGVTSAIMSSSGSNAGIGFAIPSAIVQKVVPALITSGRYEHPWLGISGVSLYPEIAGAMGLRPEQRGALVIDVIPGSPCDAAGLRGSDRQVEIDGEKLRVGGDIITAIDGQPVRGFDDIISYLARSTSVGQEVVLSVLSQGKEKEARVRLAARPASQQEEQVTKNPESPVWLGIVGMNLSPEIAEAMGLPPDQKGVLVEQVQQNSPADEAGLYGSFKPIIVNGQQVMVGGDIIVGLGNETVEDIARLQSLLRNRKPGDEVLLKVLRGGETKEIRVTLAELPAQP